MKKVYLFAIALIFVATVNAQSIKPNRTFEAKQNFPSNEISVVERAPAGPTFLERGGGGVLFTEDFANGLDGNNGFGEWTTDDTADGTIWMVADDASPAGEWSTTTGALESTTADNGWMIFDCDRYNTQFAGSTEGEIDGGEAYVDVEGTLTSPMLDFSGINAVVVEWEHYYRFCCSDEHPLTLEVSNDGGDTFTRFNAAGVNPSATNSFSGTISQSVDISCVAANSSDVVIQWAWRQPEGGGDSHYVWGIDDITIFENQTGNDITIGNYASYTDYETTGTYEYGVWPFSQLVELQAAANYQVLGTVSQPNATLTVTAGDYSESTDPQELFYPTCVDDTLRVFGYTPEAVEGMYDVTFEIASDSTDATPDDNVRVQSFEVSEFIYAQDNSEITGVFPADGEDEFIAASGFQIFNDVTVYGIDVALMNGSDAGTDIVAYILDADLEVIEATEEIELNPEFLNSTNATDIVWTTFLFDDPVDVSGDTFVCAAFNHYGGNEVQVGESKTVPPQSCFVNGDFGSAGFDWYFTTEAPMVRLNLNPNAVQTPNDVSNLKDKEGNRLFQNNPNPSNGITKIRFEMMNAGEVVLEIRDMTGRIVETRDLGTLGTGVHAERVDTNSMESGLYTYSVIIDGSRLTKTMVVAGN